MNPNEKHNNNEFQFLKIVSDETETKMRKELSAQIDTIFYSNNYNWKPIEYTETTAWAYLYGRAAKEYAIILKIFSEIAKRDPEYKPRSFFDFGAGVGTGTWAASQLWDKSIFEYFCVDKSSEMNELSDLILHNAKRDKRKNIFYRQFLPASEEVSDCNIWHTIFELNLICVCFVRFADKVSYCSKCIYSDGTGESRGTAGSIKYTMEKMRWLFCSYREWNECWISIDRRSQNIYTFTEGF